MCVNERERGVFVSVYVYTLLSSVIKVIDLMHTCVCVCVCVCLCVCVCVCVCVCIHTYIQIDISTLL